MSLSSWFYLTISASASLSSSQFLGCSSRTLVQRQTRSTLGTFLLELEPGSSRLWNGSFYHTPLLRIFGLKLPIGRRIGANWRQLNNSRIDAFELWCWRRLLRVPWTARSNQPILKEINPDYSLEGLMLKLQYFGHLMQRATHWKIPWCWERLKAGGEGNNRGWDGWMDGITDSTEMSLSKLWEVVKDRVICCGVHGVTKSWMLLSDWTTTTYSKENKSKNKQMGSN